MHKSPTFSDVVEAADHLSPDEQNELVSIIQKRLAAIGRARVVADVQESIEELDAGRVKPMSVDQIMKATDS